MHEKVKPFLPVYTRPPNVFLRYEETRFDDGYGHTGIARTAFFLTKKKEEMSMIAQIIWDNL
jgi:hypothetical protein